MPGPVDELHCVGGNARRREAFPDRRREGPAPQLSRRFQRAAQRPMTGPDWAGYVAAKAIVQAVEARMHSYLDAVLAPYTAGFYHYVRAELKFESDLPYEILSSRVHPWSFKEFEGQAVYVAETLRKAMTLNPHLKVFVANGYYDLGTPYFATEYTFNHLGLDESVRGNVTMGYYEAGHMMYIHIPSLKQMKIDLSGFIRKSS